ncbi:MULTISPECIES: TatD family hydrolase [Mycobacteriaceae]|uniref:TatD family hydrolase n=1 Tax=Mycolicibacterium parafortuitum TaxID=39692 RepID=A0ACC6MQF7_MYCPF|nr:MULTISPECIES: TatD family hydrolase [Mycobacteriaceae]MDZ5089127.1 TatD family hydrolase [Mycolicibacterium parafortuitum]GFM21330.1 TatD related DNase family protein [Mycobacterium sp. PO1]GFM26792.1 TatD related DNase family protein [Mycobacterium sp. PO2]
MSEHLLPLDAHAHIDAGISAGDVANLDAFVFAMTRSLDEFANLSRNDRRAVWAIGVHPGLVRSQRAFTADKFRRLLSTTPVVGETGLDGASRVPMSVQLETFRSVLAAVADEPRILSVHSYQAQAEVLRELNRLPVQGVILHWWTGSPGLTEEAVRLGCYFSVPPAAAGVLGPDFLRLLPQDRILTETDHPSGDRRGPLPRRPGNVREVERNLRRTWALDDDATRTQVWRNLANLADETSTVDLFGPDWRTAFEAARR